MLVAVGTSTGIFQLGRDGNREASDIVHVGGFAGRYNRGNRPPRGARWTPDIIYAASMALVWQSGCVKVSKWKVVRDPD
nr:uncharacterized protein CTRU02_10887 [Colletotrichum truncatum]KAF6786763.1 hypothetical protein CTRU02_10887 [Colletotrichum truncatum]